MAGVCTVCGRTELNAGDCGGGDIEREQSLSDTDPESYKAEVCIRFSGDVDMNS